MQFRPALILIPALTLGAFSVKAQSVSDAYNLSNLTVQGTARSMGFGNALGSIGGDFSSISVNPAGLGIYRASEWTLTPALRINSSSSEYLGVVTSDNNTRFNFNNYGIVFTNAAKGKRYEKKNWKAVSFAIGSNRVADLNRNHRYTGVNYANSGAQAMEADANQYKDDPFSKTPLTVPGYVGYQSYLINYFPLEDNYRSVVPYQGGVKQEKIVQERGRISETVIALGGNYKEQLMLGATLGIPTVRYTVTSTYTESLAPGNNSPNPDTFSSFRLDQTTTVKGNGVNLKLGAIFRANDNVRVGAAFHTPTILALSDTYVPGIRTVIGSYDLELNTSNTGLPTNVFSYSFVTPWRGILSGSYIMKGVGFITLDYEYVGYNSMGYLYPTDDGYGNKYAQQEYDMNKKISDTYQNTSNVRLGAEALVSKYFMARLGLGYYSNPYKLSNMNGQRIDLGGGIGFRDKEFFVDLAFVHSIYQAQTQPYSIDYAYIVSSAPSTVPTAKTNYGINNIAFTVGFKF